MLWSGSELERGIAIGGLASTVMPYVMRFLGQILIAAILAIATAAGKDIYARYIRENFRGRGKRRDND